MHESCQILGALLILNIKGMYSVTKHKHIFVTNFKLERDPEDVFGCLDYSCKERIKRKDLEERSGSFYCPECECVDCGEDEHSELSYYI